MTMTTSPPTVACLSSSLSLPSRSSPSSRAVAASSAWVPAIFLAWSTSCLYHSQANDPARVRRMTPIITAFKSVRRHLIGKCSRPLQGVARPPDGADQLRLPGRGYLSYSAHLFFLTFLEKRVASILSTSYQCIYTLHAQRAGCILKWVCVWCIINPSAWKRNSRKFTVATGSPTHRQALTNRPCYTPLGSKPGDFVPLVASSCIKGLRLVTVQLPEKFLRHRIRLLRSSHTTCSAKYGG